MSDLIAVTGNLTSAPERRELSGGVVMARFGLASTERRFDNGSWTDVHTNFYEVAVYRRLAEHALSSLQRGQRVIVMGKLRVRRWEAGGRTGTTVDLEATSLGPDLRFGTASFVRDAPANQASDAFEAPGAASADAWATPGEAQRVLAPSPDGDAEATGEGEGGPVLAPAGAAPGVAPQPPELVPAGGWGDDPTPF